jgi:hypothetical protein
MNMVMGLGYRNWGGGGEGISWLAKQLLAFQEWLLPFVKYFMALLCSLYYSPVIDDQL